MKQRNPGILPYAALGLLLCPAFLNGAVPRSDYPQPQFQRELWMNLNGAWEFEFDDANVGAKQNWPDGSHKFSKSITVPYCFESKLSGIGDPAFHPYVWYRRSFAVSAEWRSKRVLLHFGAVDYEARVWLNGKFAGSHRGGQTPFSLDVTDLLNPGENSIMVRAEDQPEE